MVFIHVIRGRPSGLLQFPAGEAVKDSLEIMGHVKPICDDDEFFIPALVTLTHGHSY